MAGTGTGNIEAWRTKLVGASSLWAVEHKTNPTDPSDLTEAGYSSYLAINSTAGTISFGGDLLAPGYDLGTSGARLDAVYCTTLDATTITGSLASCGTSCNVWEVNNDAVGTSAELTGIALPA